MLRSRLQWKGHYSGSASQRNIVTILIIHKMQFRRARARYFILQNCTDASLNGDLPTDPKRIQGQGFGIAVLANLQIRHLLAGFGYQVALSQLKVPSTSMYHMTYASCCGQVIESASEVAFVASTKLIQEQSIEIAYSYGSVGLSRT